jgi:hypothetical protein
LSSIEPEFADETWGHDRIKLALPIMRRLRRLAGIEVST